MVFRSEENAAVAAALLSPSFSLAAANHASDVLDMPVDPNEPTYCLCHQVSYGEMIGCDNIDVRFPAAAVHHICKVQRCQFFQIIWISGEKDGQGKSL